MLDALFGFQFIQTTTGSPEQMPMDRDEKGRAGIRRFGWNRGPCCSSGRKVGSWKQSCQPSAKRQGLHPGAHTAIPGVAGLLRQRATLEKPPEKERSIYSMEPRHRRHLPGSTRSSPRPPRALSAAAPPGLLLHTGFLSSRSTQRKIYLLLSRFGILLPINGINVILIAPGCWSTATEPEKLGSPRS